MYYLFSISLLVVLFCLVVVDVCCCLFDLCFACLLIVTVLVFDAGLVGVCLFSFVAWIRCFFVSSFVMFGLTVWV